MTQAPETSHLIGKDRAGIAELLSQLGVPDRQLNMRANQLWQWLYVHGLTDFAPMTNIAAEMRRALAHDLRLDRPAIVTGQKSSDGTRKWLLQLGNRTGEAINAPEIETVYIPEPNRGTLCISSQIGCTLNCTFCHTGTQKLVRNLTAREIVSQVLIAKDELGDWPGEQDPAARDPALPAGRPISNIVLMGMGEPLYNFDAVKAAVAIISDNEGLSISKRRITLSTAGVVPMIERCGAEIGVMLAISLHGVRNDIRDKLVPLNRKYPIEQLLDACRTYPGLSNARRITFEYVMLQDINDTPADARELVRLLKGIPAKINLIPFNPWPGSSYECSAWVRIEAFAEIVNRAGYASPVRTPRGRDIMAACGQLKSASEKQRKRVTA
jgi:23S rRNA (adenine2503-C2)-methyltransferase